MKFGVKNLVVKNLALLLALALSACDQPVQLPKVSDVAASVASAQHSNASIEQAFASKRSDVQVSGNGVVAKLLADDAKGSRHQKFLVKINDRQTLLFAHNLDLAERLPLAVGDAISFSGEYVYNPKGGIIHWTHHDPRASHPAGWVMLRGTTYQ
jgi:LEA14-like dessication related protein